MRHFWSSDNSSGNGSSESFEFDIINEELLIVGYVDDEDPFGTTQNASVTKGMDSAFVPELQLTLPELILATFLAAIILVTIIGNTLVIAAVATTRRLRTITNFFVVSLAVSDLLVGFLVMPIAVVEEMSKTWLLGKVVCELWISMDVMLCTASILNLCCISVDRYFAITSPMVYAVKRSSRLAILMIGVVWILSALITCPPMFGWHERNRQNSTDCAYNSNQGYVIYSALGSFYIPAIIIVYVYSRIFAAARRRQEVLVDGDTNNSSAATRPLSESPRIILTENSAEKNDREIVTLSEVSCNSRVHLCSPKMRAKPAVRANSDPVQETNCVRRVRTTGRGGWRSATWKMPPKDSSSRGCQRSYSIRHLVNHRLDAPSGTLQKQNYERAAFQRERRVAKSLSVVVGGFFVCWLPFFITYLIGPFCSSCYFDPTLQSCLVWLGWVNSTVNPFIYAFNNVDFKKAFVRLTIGKFRRRRKPLKHHNPQNFL